MIAFIALAEAILTIDPPTPFIAGSTDRPPRNTPRKFTPKMKSTYSSVASVIGLTVATPASLIRASIRPARGIPPLMMAAHCRTETRRVWHRVVRTDRYGWEAAHLDKQKSNNDNY